jgi:imidazolonepropionase-like amidohydrolase
VIAITGATAWLGPDLSPTDRAVVLVDGSDIVAAGAGIELPGGSEVVDATGLTLIPGFIDAHVHIGFARPHDVIAGGVTTARDLAWPPEQIWPLVATAAAPSFDGPYLVAAGQMLTVEGGYPTRAPWAPAGTGRVIRSPREVDAAVGEQVAKGATVIKVALNAAVGPTLDLPTLRAVVEAAAAAGLRVTAHITGLDELHKALDAKVPELAHMLMSDERIPDETIARMVGDGTTIVPTLSCRFEQDRQTAIDNLARFFAAGGRVVYGTDLGNTGPKPGIDKREVGAMSEAGMTGREIVASATTQSAPHLRLDCRGVLAAGMYADLVAVKGDPSVDPLSATNVRMVWREGRRLR